MKVCLYAGDMNLIRKDEKKGYVEIQKGGGSPLGGILAPYQMALFFADEQPYMCTLSWYTSARAQ